jgi:hypothetical protein
MNWKGMGAFFVLALFLLSVPVAFAEDNADNAADDTVTVADDAVTIEDADNADAATTATQVTIREKAKERLTVAKANIANAKEQFELAKQQYATAREQYADAKQSIEDNRERLKECKEEATGDCKLVVKKVKKDVKNFLLGAADRILAALEKVQSRVETSSMTDEKKVEILADLEERVAAVEIAKESINALTETSTKDEIKEAAAELRDAWKGAKAELKTGVGKLANEKIHGVIVKSEQLRTKLEKTIAKLEEKGYDVSGLEELKASFDAKLADAKASYDAAVAKYKEATTPGEVDELMKAANAEMKAAQESLKEAHQILKEIVDEIKGTQERGVEEENETEVEEEEETEETPENETEVEEEEETEETPENETEVEEEEETEETPENETEED